MPSRRKRFPSGLKRHEPSLIAGPANLRRPLAAIRAHIEDERDPLVCDQQRAPEPRIVARLTRDDLYPGLAEKRSESSGQHPRLTVSCTSSFPVSKAHSSGSFHHGDELPIMVRGP